MGANARGRELLGGLDAQRHLAAGADQHHLRVVGATDDAGTRLDGRSVGAHRDGLAAEHQRGRAVVGDGRLPRGDGLVGVGRADDLQLRDGPQRGELLDRLVCRAVLADADGVVRPHEDHLGAD